MPTKETAEAKKTANPKKKKESKRVPALKLKVYPKGEGNSIYRHILVPEETTLTNLCHIILDAFEFDYDHLYEFIIGPYTFEAEAPAGLEYGDLHTLEEQLADFNFEKGDYFYLHYDFGDDWVFAIKVLENTVCKEGEWLIKREKGLLLQYPDCEDFDNYGYYDDAEDDVEEEEVE